MATELIYLSRPVRTCRSWPVTASQILMMLYLYLYPNVRSCELWQKTMVIRDSGPFLWACAAVCDMPVETAGNLEAGALSVLLLSIDADGGITGSWYYRGLSDEECNAGRITPKPDSDPAVKMRIIEALRPEHRRSCILLREGRDTKPWLLVMAVGWGQHTTPGDSGGD